MTAPLEIEFKARFASAEAARRALAAAGAAETRARHFEDNRVFDTPARDLAARRALLRVRAASDGRAAVTFKEKVGDDVGAKVRREWETAVTDAATLGAILERAGLEQTYRYQKYRTVFRLGAAVVDLDETPMGCFIEIEGSDESLAAAARALGVAEADRIVEDYRSLWIAWSAGRGRPEGDMLFEDAP